jgi:RNA polymerase sigma-70 factor (ECF subfamily)
MAAWARHSTRLGLRIEPTEVNGQPGAVLRDAEDAILGVMTVDIAEGRVAAVRSVVNPEKLAHLR